MEIKFANIEERDTDFAIIRAFKNNSKVRELFFKQINRSGELVKIFHSLIQKESDGHDGESDIVFICKDEQGPYAIFIEDKIAADPQPNQCGRYKDRAEIYKGEEYQEAFIFLCAPKAYLNSDKADGYERKVAHEDIKALVEDDLDKEIFKNSIDPKKQKYTPIKSDAVTEFWGYLIDYIETFFPELEWKTSKKIRGSKSLWPTFSVSPIKGLSIIWKSDQNVVDLEFSGMADHRDYLFDLLKTVGVNKPLIEKTGKSLVLREPLPKNSKVFFDKPFDKQKPNVKECLKAALKLRKIADKIVREGVCCFPCDKDE